MATEPELALEPAGDPSMSTLTTSSVTMESAPAVATPARVDDIAFTLPRLASLLLIGLMGLMLIGMAINLSRLLSGIVRVIRLQLRGSGVSEVPFDHEILHGLHRSIHVKETEDVSSPAAAGLFSSTILLPVGLSEEMTTDELNQIILHEAAHLE